MDTLANRAAGRPRLHPALVWVFAGSLLASAWALWWPNESMVVAQSDAPDSPSQTMTSSGALGQSVPGMSAPVAADGERPTLSPPSRDPFNIAPSALTDLQVKPTPEPVREERAPPPPAPAAPAMNHAVIGRFFTPEGQRLVFLQDGSRTVVAQPSVVLSSGYVIETVTAKEVRLRHPLAEQAVSISLPDDNAP